MIPENCEKAQEIALSLAKAMIEAVKEATESSPMRGIPTGTIYVAFMTHGVSIHAFENIKNACIDAGAISEKNHLLTYNFRKEG